MESVFGLVSKDFAIVVADTSAVHSILVHKTNEDKTMVLDSHKLMRASGVAVLNHAEVISFLRDDDTGRIIGARIRNHLSGKAHKRLSAWTGIRPLVVDSRAKTTESISRDHVVCEDEPGLVIITSGKWTIYRSFPTDVTLDGKLMKFVWSGLSVSKIIQIDIGHWIHFSPSVINAYLGRKHVVAPAPVFDLNEIAAELTGGSWCVWPSSRVLLASDLSVKYSILHKITVCNWIPSTHNSTIGKPLGLLLFNVGTRMEFNLGQLIFEHVVAHVESSWSQQPIRFPGLIFSLIMAQQDVVNADDFYKPEALLLIISLKLSSSQHAQDIPARDDAASVRTVPPSVPNRSALSLSVTFIFFDRHIKSLERKVQLLKKSIRAFKLREQELESFLIDLRVQALGLASPFDAAAGPFVDQPSTTAAAPADVDADDDASPL